MPVGAVPLPLKSKLNLNWVLVVNLMNVSTFDSLAVRIYNERRWLLKKRRKYLLKRAQEIWRDFDRRNQKCAVH